jgi:hypothetical protein
VKPVLIMNFSLKFLGAMGYGQSLYERHSTFGFLKQEVYRKANFLKTS